MTTPSPDQPDQPDLPDEPAPDPGEVTQILGRVSSREDGAVDVLMPLVYAELRRIASRHLASERKDHTLSATALVHEAYLKLVDQTRVDWQNRAHFFAVSALAMRRILVNHAKAKLAQKRGGGQPVASLGPDDETPDRVASREEDVIAIDEALEKLAALDERQAKIVELRFFAGLEHQEIAEALGVSEPTVRRDWRFARAWLGRELKSE